MKSQLLINWALLKSKCLLTLSCLIFFSLGSLHAATISTGTTTATWSGTTINLTDADNVSVADIITKLAIDNVTINVTGNVTFNAALTSTAGNNLTITADGNITIDAALNLTGAVGPNANAGQTGGKGGSVNLISANGDVAINQPIKTTGGKGGNATQNANPGGDGGNSGIISIDASSGTITINNSLTSNGGDGGNGQGQSKAASAGNGNNIALKASNVNINATLEATGGVGKMAAGGGAHVGGKGGNGGNISVTADGDIVVSGTSTKLNSQGSAGVEGDRGDGAGGVGGNIILKANAVTIEDIETINSSGATGGGARGGTYLGGVGGNAGKITIETQEDIFIDRVANGINAQGGTGGTGISQAGGNTGGLGNDITLISASGKITIDKGNVNSSGGIGGAAPNNGPLAGNGGAAGKITIDATDIDIQSTLLAFGGNAGAPVGGNQDGALTGAKGGKGGDITVKAVQNVSISGATTTIDTHGGNGTNALNGKGHGGDAGDISITSKNGTTTIGDIKAINAAGGDGGKVKNNNNAGGTGGNAGSVTIFSYTDLSVGTIADGIIATGGKGGDRVAGATAGGGTGGNGGTIRLISDEGELTTSAEINVSAGKAGDGQENPDRIPGAAGNVLVSAKNDITVEGAITANGGNDGASTQNSAANPYGATDGGSITISSSDENVTIKAPIEANGGIGAQRSNGRCGSKGGSGGSIVIEALKEINIEAKITANGNEAGLMPPGQSGSTDVTCYPGGNGGTIDLVSGEVNVDAPVEAVGGTGGTSGSNGGDNAGQGGNGGTVNVDGTLNTGGGSIKVDGGKGGSKNGNGGGNCSEGGAGGNLNVNGNAPVSGSQGDAGGASCKLAILCPPPVIEGLYELLPPFCLATGTNLEQKIPIPTVDWLTSSIGSVKFELEDKPAGSGKYTTVASPFDYTVADNDDDRLRVRYVATNACGQKSYAYAVITKSCPNITAVLSGGGNLCKYQSTELDITISGGTGPYTVVYNDGDGDVTLSGITSPYKLEVDPLVNKSYSLVSVTDESNGKTGVVSGSATVTVIVCDFPDAMLSLVGDDVICAGSAAKLRIDIVDGIKPWDIVYSDGANNITIPGISASPYFVDINPGSDVTYTLVSVTDSDGTVGTVNGIVDITVVYPQTVTIHEENSKTNVSPGEEIEIGVSPNNIPLKWWFNEKEVAAPQFPMALYNDLLVVVGFEDGVCPTVLSNEIYITVAWPTAISPYKEGDNAYFLKGFKQKIYVFNRHGVTMFNGTGGWDGKYKGKEVEPGVYYYVIDLPDGETRKATLEVVKEK